MSSAITNAGKTRINVLVGQAQPLVIDRMVFALIPGLDPDLPVDRDQGMPPAEQIMHTATIAAEHKGYVTPDQVVYSVILGTDLGNWSFNWIGLIEEATDTIIAITTHPQTPKRKTDLGSNITGNIITRNFVMQFQDAQNLTGISIAAETWQFDYTAEFAAHEAGIVNPAVEGSVGKHVTDSQAKVWQDHVYKGVVNPYVTESVARHLTSGQAKVWQDHVDAPPLDLYGPGGSVPKHVTDSQAKVWQDHVNMAHDFMPAWMTVAFMPAWTTVFDYSATWTVPAGVTRLIVEGCGGGGAGGNCADEIGGSGAGGDGGYSYINGIVGFYGGSGGESYDIGSEPGYGGSDGGLPGIAMAIVSRGVALSDSPAGKGEHGSYEGGTGEGGANSYGIGGHRAAIHAVNPGTGGAGAFSGSLNGGGGGAARVGRLLLDVIPGEQFSIVIGGGGVGAGGGNGAPGRIIIQY